MDLRLRGKIAAVAGSSRGIGKAIARGLAGEGMSIAVNGRNPRTVEVTAAEISAATGASVLPIPLDVATKEGAEDFVRRTAEEFGALDVLVTNAGGPQPGNFLDLTDQDFQNSFELNFLSVVRMVRVAIPYLKARGGGRVINLQSTGAKQPVPGVTLTNSIRPAVLGLSKDLANHLAAYQITVNTILAGPTKTDRLDHLIKSRAAAWHKREEDVWAEYLKGVPLGRWGAPEDIANLVVYLASQQAGWTTGTVIQVDGGRVQSIM